MLLWLDVRPDSFLKKEAKSGDAERMTRRDEGQV